MATRTGVGYSEQTDSAEAGWEAARQAILRTGGACDLALLFATSRHDPARLRDAVRSVIGERTRLVGGYAFGVLTGDRLGYNGSQVGVAVLSSDDIRFDVVSTGDLDRGERAAGLRLGAAAARGGAAAEHGHTAARRHKGVARRVANHRRSRHDGRSAVRPHPPVA